MIIKRNSCVNCKLRGKYEKDPQSLLSRFWHWHIGFCPGWKAYFNHLSEEEKNVVRRKYRLK